MILGWYGVGSGNHLADAVTMASPAYMNTDPATGEGSSSAFQIGLVNFAAAQGATVDATLHMNQAIYSYYNWSPYTLGPQTPTAPHLATDANFYNADWTINKTAFLNFVDTQIKAGNPVGVTVDTDGMGVVDKNGVYSSTDHWMVAVGVQLEHPGMARLRYMG